MAALVVTPTLRAMQILRLFGLQRAHKTIGDYPVGAGRAYLDGEHVMAG
jgi:hypothetical protein